VRARGFLAVVAVALVGAPARAHLVQSGLGPIYDGISHFALTPQDVLPVFALAIFSSLRGKGQARSTVLLLPAAWLAGGIVGSLAPMSFLTIPAWLPLLALGAMVAADLTMPGQVTIAISILLGLALGDGNGSAMAAGAGVGSVVGTACAVFVASTLAAACVTVWQTGWRRIAWRVLGSWIAASGLLLLGWSLRR
jgi:urease accessory protein